MVYFSNKKQYNIKANFHKEEVNMATIKKEVVTKEYYEELQAQYRDLIDVLRPQVLE